MVELSTTARDWLGVVTVNTYETLAHVRGVGAHITEMAESDVKVIATGVSRGSAQRVRKPAAVPTLQNCVHA